MLRIVLMLKTVKCLNQNLRINRILKSVKFIQFQRQSIREVCSNPGCRNKTNSENSDSDN